MKKILNDNYKCEGQISLFDIADKPIKFHEAEWLRAHGFKNVYEEPPKAGIYEFTDIEHPTKTKQFEVSENGAIKIGGSDFVARWWRPIKGTTKAAAPAEDFMNPPKSWVVEATKADAIALCMKIHTEIEKNLYCEHSKHSCNKKELWKVADTLDDIQCPHVCCRMCNTRNCGARCNGSEEPKRTPQIYRYLRYGPHTLVAEVREEAKAWLDQNGVPEWVKWSKSSLPCENCTWWDGTNCCSGGHTNHYEYGYLICDGFYQSCVMRKPSTVGEGFPQGIKQEPHIYPLDIKGICDDPYCPQCGYAFETIKTCKNYEVDCERCPECHVKVDWTLWHRMNDKEVT